MPHQSFISVRQFLIRLKSDSRGQDLIEYALLSGFMVIAIWALFPTGIVPSISHVFSRLLQVASTLVP
jgi:Flp pilus assembly pilin Flp